MSALASAGALRVHQLLEALGYLVAGLIYVRERRRAGDTLPDQDRLALVVAAAVGATVRSRVLFWLWDPALTARHWRDVSRRSFSRFGRAGARGPSDFSSEGASVSLLAGMCNNFNLH